MDYLVTNYGDELYHYGVKGMKWGIRRRTPEEKAAARYAKGERKQSKIVKKQNVIKADNEYQKQSIREAVKVRNSIKSEKLTKQSEKDQLDRRLNTRDYWTERGRRKDQDRSFNLNSRIKELESKELANEAAIARAIEQMDINKQKISKLDDKYARIGRRYMGIA